MVVLVCGVMLKLAESSPETVLLTRDAAHTILPTTKGFFRNLKASFVDLRTQLNNGDKRFATTQHPACVCQPWSSAGTISLKWFVLLAMMLQCLKFIAVLMQMELASYLMGAY